MKWFVLSIFYLSVSLSGLTTLANPIEIKATPLGPDEELSKALTSLALEHPTLKKRLNGANYRVIEVNFDPMANRDEKEWHSTTPPAGRDQEWEAGPFDLKIYDYTSDRLLSVLGDFNDPAHLELSESEMQPNPSFAEFQSAVEILSRDARFLSEDGQRLWRPYASMPPVLELPDQKGRIIAVGMMPLDPESGDFVHEIVGVNLSRGGKVIRFSSKAPPMALATERVCAPRNSGQPITARGTPGSVLLEVSKGGELLWKMKVIRPASSSGYWGSGIDLRDVEYRGAKIFSRMNVPLLNVQYDYNRCGPFRDWMYSEDAFEAEGELLASGIIRTQEPATTIVETRKDRGNFRGVAVYQDGADTVLVTELQAGWYRYKNEYRFSEDGSIRPAWTFDAIQDSCTCNRHHHHAYWRMDFDLGDPKKNQVEYFDGNAWVPVVEEARFQRDRSHQRWRVYDVDTGKGYEIRPGENDSTADRFGKGDVWVLRYMRGQLDDSGVYQGASVNLDAFVAGQEVESQDVVLWYAGHYIHEFCRGADCRDLGEVGPRLIPFEK